MERQESVAADPISFIVIQFLTKRLPIKIVCRPISRFGPTSSWEILNLQLMTDLDLISTGVPVHPDPEDFSFESREISRVLVVDRLYSFWVDVHVAHGDCVRVFRADRFHHGHHLLVTEATFSVVSSYADDCLMSVSSLH